MGEDDVAGDCDIGGGTVTTGSGLGTVTAGSGVDEDISGVAGVHPADSNITSVSGIRIRDSFFIVNPPSLSSVWILLI